MLSSQFEKSFEMLFVINFLHNHTSHIPTNRMKLDQKVNFISAFKRKHGDRLLKFVKANMGKMMPKRIPRLSFVLGNIKDN